jgi:hypothetical protein
MTRYLALVALLSLGPYDIQLHNTPKTPNARGTARLVFAESPFGVTVTADGHASYDVQLSLSGLPEPSALGPYKAYVAWGVTTDLKQWRRLGPVGNGESTWVRSTSTSSCSSWRPNRIRPPRSTPVP